MTKPVDYEALDAEPNNALRSLRAANRPEAILFTNAVAELKQLRAELKQRDDLISAPILAKWNDSQWRSWAKLHSEDEYRIVELAVALGTEQAQHHAWRKRAEEAEKDLTELRAERERLLELPDIELVAAKVHEAWFTAKYVQGVQSREAEDGEELMVEYQHLSEKAKELDRSTVRAVYAAIAQAKEVKG